MTRPDPGDRTEIFLDPEEARRQRARRQHRLNVVSYPLARIIGTTFLLLAVLLHNHFILGALSPAGFAAVAVGLLGYSLLAWLVLSLFYGKVGRVDLGDVFMVGDIVAWTCAIYASGGERSWLLVETREQRGSTFHFTPPILPA